MRQNILLILQNLLEGSSTPGAFALMNDAQERMSLVEGVRSLWVLGLADLCVADSLQGSGFARYMCWVRYHGVTRSGLVSMIDIIECVRW